MTITNTIEAQLLTPKQFCDQYNISIATLYRIFARGEIVPIKIGRATRIKVSDAQAWINSLSQAVA